MTLNEFLPTLGALFSHLSQEGSWLGNGMSWLVHKGHSSQGVPNYYYYRLQMCDPPPPAGPRTYQLLMALEPQQEDQGHCRGMTESWEAGADRLSGESPESPQAL